MHGILQRQRARREHFSAPLHPPPLVGPGGNLCFSLQPFNFLGQSSLQTRLSSYFKLRSTKCLLLHSQIGFGPQPPCVTHPDSDKVPPKPVGPRGNKCSFPMHCFRPWDVHRCFLRGRHSPCPAATVLWGSSQATVIMHRCVCVCVSHTHAHCRPHQHLHTDIPPRYSCDLNSEMFSGVQSLTLFCGSDNILILLLFAEFWVFTNSYTDPCEGKD